MVFFYDIAQRPGQKRDLAYLDASQIRFSCDNQSKHQFYTQQSAISVLGQMKYRPKQTNAFKIIAFCSVLLQRKT